MADRVKPKYFILSTIYNAKSSFVFLLFLKLFRIYDFLKFISKLNVF